MNFKKIVIKIGTSTIADEKNGLPNLTRMTAIVKILAELKKSGTSIVIVSSGAIGIGAGKLGLLNQSKTIEQKQACASIGQYALMNLYDDLFKKHNLLVSQILLTNNILNNTQSKLNSKNTFDVLLSSGIIPIVNANDTVSTSELEFSDNDTLASLVTSLIDADILIILTDLDGIYNKNPKTNSNAVLIKKINKIDKQIRKNVKGKPNFLGTGGMETKLKAAEFLSFKKIPTVILNGNFPDRIYSIFKKEIEGTLIDIANVF